MKRVEADDPIASNNLGYCYEEGSRGFPQDHTKALELWHRAAELGHTDAYCSVGYAFDYGEGVEVDKEKAMYYYEIAAIGGSVAARYRLGLDEFYAGNMDRAVKHFLISVRGGFSTPLEKIKSLYIFKRTCDKRRLYKSITVISSILG